MNVLPRLSLFRLLCLSAILIMALAACGPAATNPGAAGTPGVSGTSSVGGSTDLTGTPSTGADLTGTPSTDLTGTPSAGGTSTVDQTGTPAAGGTSTVDLTGTPAAGTSTVDLTGTPSVGGTSTVDTTGTPSAMGTGTAVVPVTGGPAVVNVANDPTLGQILVDANGMTLYTTSGDTSGVSNCSADCQKLWPPLLTNGTPVAGAGVDATQLGTIPFTSGSSSDMGTSTPSATDLTSTPSSGTGSGSTSGTMIVTYKGMPLYTFSSDSKPGDVTGNNVTDIGGTWKVAVP